MWWKLAGLAFIEAVIVGLLFVPIPTHAVMYNTADAMRGHEHEIYMQAAVAIILPLALLFALIAPIWLAYRIVKENRKPTA